MNDLGEPLNIPCRGVHEPNSSGITWQQNSDRRIKCRRRRLEVIFFTEVADDVHHADFSDAAAVIDEWLGGLVVVAGPNADVGIVGGLECGEGVADSGGDSEWFQRRLAETEVSYLMRQ